MASSLERIPSEPVERRRALPTTRIRQRLPGSSTSPFKLFLQDRYLWISSKITDPYFIQVSKLLASFFADIQKMRVTVRYFRLSANGHRGKVRKANLEAIPLRTSPIRKS